MNKMDADLGPYGVYTNTKAELEIKGDLESMATGWTPAEINSNRRLVQVSRSQLGNKISMTFQAVAPEKRIPDSICISCIWWESKKECFVTSVDTIYLLESLVSVRFTVEEKNRIRRNLEGFRPLTVSKSKPDSEDFFKVIMGFPVPKPRNIEKDVKVFPWRILASALKKIIGKYVSFFYCFLVLSFSLHGRGFALRHSERIMCLLTALLRLYDSLVGELHTIASRYDRRPCKRPQ